MKQWTLGTTFPLPKADASEDELRDHFKKVGTVFASVTFNIAQDLCQVCCKDGENSTGKKDNPGGRNRFCSDECEAVFTRRWALYRISHPVVPERGKS